ncbi:Serine/threonine protein kinase [Streptosporangium canum]|uniref:Serine/threonine protein kinase n=1 Tax=Streptosporangium canum TaxID=324952 RepID=A0A1I3IQH0_9ACTN|nr:hypothetical protein [Streptosporangium canum]SFI50090.1 Serine/threonine protein kinase [Streptosporangium canum]
MNRPDVPRSQGRHAGGPASPGAPSPAVLEQASLEQVIGRLGPMAPQQAATVGLAVLDQLVVVHGQGMLHGDVRPGSVLLGPYDQIILSAPTFRSPTFTAPEGVTGPAADLWSLGATLYTAVEGRAPSPGGSLDNAGPIAPILFQLLSGDPAQRPSPGALRNILLGISQNRGEAPAPPPPAPADLLSPPAPLPPAPVDLLSPPAPLPPSPADLLSPPDPLSGPPPADAPPGSPDAPPGSPSSHAPPPSDALPGVPPPSAPFETQSIVPVLTATAPPFTPEAASPPQPVFDSADTMPPRAASDPAAITPIPAEPRGPGAPPQAPPSSGAPASQELVPVTGRPREVLPASAAQDGPTGPTSPAGPAGPAGRPDRRAGVLVPRPVVALTGVLLLGMAVTVGVLLASPGSGSGEGEAAAAPAAGAKGLFATAPRACSLLDDKQVNELVPGFRSSEVEPAACDWLNQHDWRKPSPEKFDLRVRLVAQPPDASGVERAKEYLSGKRTDLVGRGKFATPKPTPPQNLKGIGEEAFSTGGYSSINLYGGSYKATVLFRVGNLIAQVEYERGGVRNDRDGRIAAGAQKAARWLAQSLKTDG